MAPPHADDGATATLRRCQCPVSRSLSHGRRRRGTHLGHLIERLAISGSHGRRAMTMSISPAPARRFRQISMLRSFRGKGQLEPSRRRRPMLVLPTRDASPPSFIRRPLRCQAGHPDFSTPGPTGWRPWRTAAQRGRSVVTDRWSVDQRDRLQSQAPDTLSSRFAAGILAAVVRWPCVGLHGCDPVEVRAMPGFARGNLGQSPAGLGKRVQVLLPS